MDFMRIVSQLELITTKEVLYPSIAEIIVMLTIACGIGYLVFKLTQRKLNKLPSIIIAVIFSALLLFAEGYLLFQYKKYLLEEAAQASTSKNYRDIAINYSNNYRYVTRTPEEFKNNAKQDAVRWEKAVNLAERTGSETAIALYRNQLAAIYREAGDIEKSSENAEIAYSMLGDLKYYIQQNYAAINLARNANELGNFDRAREMYLANIEITRLADVQILMARTLKEYANFEKEQGDFDKARKTYSSALNIFRPLADSQIKAEKHFSEFRGQITTYPGLNDYFAIRELKEWKSVV